MLLLQQHPKKRNRQRERAGALLHYIDNIPAVNHLIGTDPTDFFFSSTGEKKTTTFGFSFSPSRKREKGKARPSVTIWSRGF